MDIISTLHKMNWTELYIERKNSLPSWTANNKIYHSKMLALSENTDISFNFMDNTFEKFDNSFVRIDILERLFVQIINSCDENEKNKEIKMVPEMLNLLGCSKENFKKLIKNMNYKIIEKNNELFFRYIPIKHNKKASNKKIVRESPFGILKNLDLS